MYENQTDVIINAFLVPVTFFFQWFSLYGHEISCNSRPVWMKMLLLKACDHEKNLGKL